PEDGEDAPPVHRHDGEHGAEVDEHLERDRRLVDAEEVLPEDEVAGGGDGQELGEALHEAEDDGFPPGHRNDESGMTSDEGTDRIASGKYGRPPFVIRRSADGAPPSPRPRGPRGRVRAGRL